MTVFRLRIVSVIPPPPTPVPHCVHLSNPILIHAANWALNLIIPLAE